MKVPLLFVYLTVLYLGTAVVALQQPTSNAINSRRSFVQSTLATTAATFTLSSPASAEEKTAAATKPAEKKEDKPAAKSDKNSFVGSYTDPNHPGGKTTIRLTGNSVGDYVLAEVVGGGGKNEPANYVVSIPPKKLNLKKNLASFALSSSSFFLFLINKSFQPC